jgi:hypothetical protein
MEDSAKCRRRGPGARRTSWVAAKDGCQESYGPALLSSTARHSTGSPYGILSRRRRGVKTSPRRRFAKGLSTGSRPNRAEAPPKVWAVFRIALNAMPAPPSATSRMGGVRAGTGGARRRAGGFWRLRSTKGADLEVPSRARAHRLPGHRDGVTSTRDFSGKCSCSSPTNRTFPTEEIGGGLGIRCGADEGPRPPGQKPSSGRRWGRRFWISKHAEPLTVITVKAPPGIRTRGSLDSYPQGKLGR